SRIARKRSTGSMLWSRSGGRQGCAMSAARRKPRVSVIGDRRLRACAFAWLVAAGVLVLGPGAAEPAGRLDIQAELDRRQIAVGEVATLTLTVTAEGVDIPPVKVPPIAGVTVERLGESQGFSWVNGRVTRTLTVAFRLHPTDVGDVTI